MTQQLKFGDRVQDTEGRQFIFLRGYLSCCTVASSDGGTHVYLLNKIYPCEPHGGNGTGAIQDGTSYTLTATDSHAVSDGLQLRRLTPTECERLQGFPDNHTLIPWRGKPAADCPDSPRYKAIGNSMAVPVMRWIGRQITGKEPVLIDIQ